MMFSLRPSRVSNINLLRKFSSPSLPLKALILQYTYVANMLEKRSPYREGHLALLTKLVDSKTLIAAGAYTPSIDGGLFLFNYDKRKELDEFVKADPYVTAGLVSNVSVKEWSIAVVVDESTGRVLETLERKPEVRRIKIKTLTADKNMAQLAADIVQNCKYIHPSRTEEVEQLLIKLRKNAANNPTVNQNEAVVALKPNNSEEPKPERSRQTNSDSQSSNRKSGTNIDSYPVNVKDHNGSSRPPDTHRESGRDNNRENTNRSENVRESRDNRNGRDGRENNRDGRDRDGEIPVSRERERGPPVKSVLDSLPPAHMGSLDDYMEMLYEVGSGSKSDKAREEGLAVQERGTAMILKLCRDVMNLEQLIQNGTVMEALTRVLQEEYKKSADLTFNILRIFLAFSNFMEMHGLMAGYKIGALTMKVIDYEMQRTAIREKERVGLDRDYAEDVAALKEQQAQMSSQDYTAASEKLRKGRDREHAKAKALIRKQDKLLFVGMYILLNLAEDLAVERKMIKKNLVATLASTLTRSFEDLLILCITFLKKLSTIQENKDDIRDSNIIETMGKFIPCSSQPLITISLRFLFNLSFDKDLREQMIKCGYVPKLLGLLKTPVFRAKTLKLLYHLSVDDRCKAMCGQGDGMHVLMGMVINFPTDTIAKELGALVVNLSYHPRNVELMLANKGLNLLMDRLADKRKDTLLLKIVRNISLWSLHQQQETDTPELDYKHRGLWSPHIKQIMEMLRENQDNQDILIEVIGLLANLTVFDLPASSSWSRLLKDYGLMSLFSRLLVPGMVPNDLLLEVIMLVSSVASDTQACSHLASGTLIGLLYQVWKDKSEDSEILLQLIHCFHKLFCHKEAREEAMYSTRVVVDIIECLAHRNNAIRATATKLCDIVLEFDRSGAGEPGQLGKEIIRKRFESHNKIWLANNDMGGNNGGTITNHMTDSSDRLRSSYEGDEGDENWRGNGHDQMQFDSPDNYRVSQQEYESNYQQQLQHQQPYYQGHAGREDEEETDESGSYNNFAYK